MFEPSPHTYANAVLDWGFVDRLNLIRYPVTLIEFTTIKVSKYTAGFRDST